MRKVIITQTSFLIPANELADHPIVRNHWQLPLGCTLVEIDDPTFSDPDTVYPASSSRAAAIVSEAALFAPYYRQPRSLADVLTLRISTQTTWYHLVRCSRITLEWPKLLRLRGWDVAQQVQVTCRFQPRSRLDFRAFDDTIEQWQSCMRRLKILACYERITRTRTTSKITLQFNHPSTDATIALFMLLSVSREETSLRSVGLSLLDGLTDEDLGESQDTCEENDVR